ncbi:PREDICTED: uncharacterized protein LOC106811818 [Priapulus caudatus]|uniref:Uncharacterized protein LOC106811818 n=1 Tax=Priapulus caudatus TaxID=37621 RepID=A0ABM1EFQ5_PRICU|nr:PREDICTED: uncharacterized protein LOC106811818 [Priapulus caudatus]
MTGGCRILALCALLAVVGVVSGKTLRRDKRFFLPQTVVDQCDPNVGNLTFAADPNNCQVFYSCVHGWPKMELCPGFGVYNPGSQRCEDEEAAVNDVCGHIPPSQLTAALDDVNVDAAEPCDRNRCRLPECRCSGADIPGDLLASETPQMVLIMWDNSIRVADYAHLYQQVFSKVDERRARNRRLNPNGCPVAGTFFATHQFTDYAAVQSLFKHGHEIAANTITGTFDLYADGWRQANAQRWSRELGLQPSMLSRFANIPDSEIRGARAPYIQPGGNQQFMAVMENGFLYDSSLVTLQMDPPIWPYTLDYLSEAGCLVKPCPTSSFRGVWEVPLVAWLDTNDTFCSNVDSCYFPNDKEEALTLLRSNFRRHYDSNRAPFVMSLRPRWFYEAYYNLEALQEFMDELQALDDVYFVTATQALNWIRRPTRLADVKSFDGWSCDAPPPSMCDRPSLCGYFNITYRPNSEEHQGDRFFQTCNTCPAEYPWLDNPLGQ